MIEYEYRCANINFLFPPLICHLSVYYCLLGLTIDIHRVSMYVYGLTKYSVVRGRGH